MTLFSRARSSSVGLWAALALALAVAIGTLGPVHNTAWADTPAVAASANSMSPAQGVADFLTVASVLQSPRCQNCHPSDGVPRIGDAGRKHRMNLSRRSMSAGLPCTTCHRRQNTAFPHGPPGIAGAPGWRMPPLEHPMVFAGRTPHELCEQLKDPTQNGGKAIEALREHFAADPLVLWGWAPGPGRTLPPISHDVLMKHVDAWIAAGTPCP